MNSSITEEAYDTSPNKRTEHAVRKLRPARAERGRRRQMQRKTDVVVILDGNFPRRFGGHIDGAPAASKDEKLTKGRNGLNRSQMCGQHKKAPM